MEEKSNTKKIVGAIVGLLLLLVLAILLLGQGDTYEVKFDSAGGSKVSTQKVKSGEKAKKPKDPTKDGYEFVLWENDGVRYDFNEKVTEDLTLKATWKEAIKKYKVTFELEGKEETFELEKLDEDVTGYLKFEDREGYEIRWYVGDEEYDFSTPLTKDVKLTGKYVQTSSYTITFDSDGGNKIDSQKIGVGEKVKEPKAPTKKGYIFDGWYYNNAKYDFEATVKRSMKLVAHWKEDPNVKRFKVTFNTDSGTPVPPTQTVMDGDKATKPANPTKKGFVFVDWELNGTVYNFNLAVKADIELKAKWREAEVYKVTFDADNGTPVTTQEVQEGGKATAPAAPKKDKSIFIEWRLDNKKYDFNKVVTKDITLKAYYEKEVYYTLTYNANGGTVTPTSKELKKLDKYGNLPTPTYTGYTFVGWYTAANGGTAVNAETTINGNTTIYAHWTKNPVAVQSISLNKTTMTLRVGSSDTLRVTFNPTDASNKTITWSSSSNAATVDANGKVTAKSVGTATITATSNNGKKATCTVTVEAVPVDSVSLNKTTLTLKFGETSTLTATVKPDNAGDKNVTWTSSDNTVATVDSNGKVTAQRKLGTATITATSNNGKKATCTVTVTTTYRLTYNANGGSVNPGYKDLNNGAQYGTLPTPTRSGYKFDGWYTAASGGTKVSSSTTISGDTTIYAHWEEIVNYYVIASKVDNFSTDYTLTVKRNSTTMSPREISKIKKPSGSTIWEQEDGSLVVAKRDVEGLTSLKIVLVSGGEVTADLTFNN